MEEFHPDSGDYRKSITFWIESSDRDFQTMMNLFNSHDYTWSLFLGHLVIEKLLKALVAKTTGDYPKPIHDLTRLAVTGQLNCTSGQLDMLDMITTFNINARYEDYRLEFYRRCDREFTEYWINQITILRQWIKSLLSNS